MSHLSKHKLLFLGDWLVGFSAQINDEEGGDGIGHGTACWLPCVVTYFVVRRVLKKLAHRKYKHMRRED